MANAFNAELCKGSRTHLKQTTDQIKGLERAVRMIKPVSQYTSRPKQPNGLAGEVGDKGVPNAALIGAAQAVEYYVIARYGALAS